MLNCRACSFTPFTQLLGFPEAPSPRETAAARQRRRDIVSQLSQPTSEEEQPAFQRATSEERRRFRPRSPEEVLTKARAWQQYLHKRSEQSWMDESAVREILMKIAQSVDKAADPVLGGEETCVFWHGDTADPGGYPILRMVKPEESEESEVSVTRILAFLFADDEAFSVLQQIQQVAFQLACEEPLCVNLSHIALDVEE